MFQSPIIKKVHIFKKNKNWNNPRSSSQVYFLLIQLIWNVTILPDLAPRCLRLGGFYEHFLLLTKQQNTMRECKKQAKAWSFIKEENALSCPELETRVCVCLWGQLRMFLPTQTKEESIEQCICLIFSLLLTAVNNLHNSASRFCTLWTSTSVYVFYVCVFEEEKKP